MHNQAGDTDSASHEGPSLHHEAQARILMESLRSNEERYRLLLASVTNYVYTVTIRDGKTTLTEHGPGCQSVTGYSPEAYQSNPQLWYEMIHPEDRDPVVEHVHKVVHLGESSTLEHRIYHRDGSVRWVRSTLVPRPESTPEVTCYDGLVADITERKLAEERLRESEQRYRTLFEHMAQGVVYQDLAGRIVTANPAAERILGLSLKEMKGLDSDYPDWRTTREDGTPVPGEDHPSIVALKTGLPVEDVVIGVHNPKDGRRWLLVSACPLFSQNASSPVQVFTTFMDITERKDAQERYRLAESRFRTLFNNMAEGVACHRTLYDQHGKPFDYEITDVNPQYERMLGIRRDQVVGQRSRKAYQTPAPPYLERFTAVGETGIPDRFETYFEPMDRHFAISIAPLEHGCWATIFADVSDRKRLEDSLRHAQKMDAIGRLAGGVAHDFNNILTVILGHLNLVLLEPGLRQAVREPLLESIVAAERAANLTRQLLTFSRKQPIRLRALDLNDVLCGLTKMLRPIIGEDVMLQFQYEGGLPQISADAGMIEQIVMNLAVNARAAMPMGGQLFLRTKLVTISSSHVVQHPHGREGTFAVLEVEDTGCGISPEVLPRIFEPFFTTKDVGKGTGLGLATVYGIVQQHHGWVEVATEVGVGTQFRVFLPVTPLIAEKPSRAGSSAAQSGSECILVVEDEPALRSLARAHLGRLGYRVQTAATGPEALSLWEQSGTSIDLVITDLVMPGGITGVELAKRLTTQRPDLPVLFTSGYGSDVAGSQFLREGENYLPKPYEPAALAVAVRRLLDALRSNQKTN